MHALIEAHFQEMVEASLEYPDAQSFAEAICKSSESPFVKVSQSLMPYLFAALESIWRATHATIKDVRAYAGLTAAAFGRRYAIPYRTVQNWESRGGCPLYLILLIAKDVGMLHY